MRRCRNLSRRGQLFCQMCGVVPGDIDDLTREPARFNLMNPEQAVQGTLALCTSCHQGIIEMEAENPSWLVSLVKRQHTEVLR